MIVRVVVFIISMCSLFSKDRFIQEYSGVWKIERIISDGSNTFGVDKFNILDSVTYDDRKSEKSVNNDSLFGYFNKDETIDTLFISSVNIINEFEDGKTYTFTISFNDKSIPELKFECYRDYIVLINEGDLDNNGIDEISIWSPPLHGCSYMLWTYIYNGGDNWEDYCQSRLYATACNPFDALFLNNLIWKQDGKVYRKIIDPSYEPFKDVIEIIDSW